MLVRVVGRLPTRWIKTASHLQWKHPLLRRAFNRVAASMQNQDGTIQKGVGRGLAFNPGPSSAGMILGTRELGLQKAFELFVAPGMVVYDVGANVGFYSVIAASLAGASGRVVAFEPVQSNVRMLEHNASLNHFDQVCTHAFALGNDDGVATFVASKNPSWGRLKNAGTPPDAKGEEHVEIRRIDSLVRGGLAVPNVMKIDVEGAEVDVLEGARETLKSARPVLFVDLHGTNAEVGRLLDALDYEARAMGKGQLPIADAGWDAQVIAIPREAKSLMPSLEKLGTLGA